VINSVIAVDSLPYRPEDFNGYRRIIDSWSFVAGCLCLCLHLNSSILHSFLAINFLPGFLWCAG